jgi:hypothetical protein
MTSMISSSVSDLTGPVGPADTAWVAAKASRASVSLMVPGDVFLEKVDGFATVFQRPGTKVR